MHTTTGLFDWTRSPHPPSLPAHLLQHHLQELLSILTPKLETSKVRLPISAEHCFDDVTTFGTPSSTTSHVARSTTAFSNHTRTYRTLAFPPHLCTFTPTACSVTKGKHYPVNTALPPTDSSWHLGRLRPFTLKPIGAVIRTQLDTSLRYHAVPRIP